MNLAQSAIVFLFPFSVLADSLEVSKVCPVTFEKQPLGLLVLSEFWFHSGRYEASYQPSDNSTGIGVEIHFFNNKTSQVNDMNIADCDRYRMLQVRKSNSLLNNNERPIQVDIPPYFERPFYDSVPLEFGYHTHLTPGDNNDKPWNNRSVRASTVAIYDTPYISDGYGIEGEDIRVEFETCLVCQRETGFDSLLSCTTWGYQRDYLNEETGWTEPEIITPACLTTASQQFKETIDSSHIVDYHYWLDWR